MGKVSILAARQQSMMLSSSLSMPPSNRSSRSIMMVEVVELDDNLGVFHPDPRHAVGHSVQRQSDDGYHGPPTFVVFTCLSSADLQYNHRGISPSRLNV